MNHKLRTLLLCAFFVLVHKNTNAESIGAGIVLLEPTGLSGHYLLSASNSIDMGLGFDLVDSQFHFHSTYLWLSPQSISLKVFNLGWYGGVGGKLWRQKSKGRLETFLGPRGSFGLNYLFEFSLELFLETALSLGIVPETDLDLDMALGCRYYW